MLRNISHYDRLQKIGDGCYGIMYKARNKLNNEWVTIKRIMIDNGDCGIPSVTMREIALLKELNNNKYIIKLYDILSFSGDLYLIFESMTYSLSSHLNKYNKNGLSLKMNEIESYLKQILCAMSYCHSLRIIHFNLNPSNILIHQHLKQIKITNFGLPQNEIIDNNDNINSLWYRSPEILLGCNCNEINKYSFSIDIWSIGCIFGEMINFSKPLFCGDSQICQIMHIFKICGTPNYENSNKWPNIDKKCKYFQCSFPKWKPKEIKQILKRNDLNQNGCDLFKKMLTLNPKNRISAKQALRHKWFQSPSQMISN